MERLPHLSSTGGMGRAASVFYIRLASLLSEKRDVHYGMDLLLVTFCPSKSIPDVH